MKKTAAKMQMQL